MPPLSRHEFLSNKLCPPSRVEAWISECNLLIISSFFRRLFDGTGILSVRRTTPRFSNHIDFTYSNS